MTSTARSFLLERLALLIDTETASTEFLDAKLASAGLDQFDLMELFNEIEEAFDIRIDDDSVSGHTAIGRMIEFVEAKVARKPQIAG